MTVKTTQHQHIVTKCYTHLDDEGRSSAVLAVRCSFLYAVESSITGLWSMAQVDYTKGVVDDLSKNDASYEFTPVKDGLELTQVFNQMSAYELSCEEQGLVHSDLGQFPHVVHFKHEAATRGYVFDQLSGKAVLADDQSLTMQNGVFDAAQLTKSFTLLAAQNVAPDIKKTPTEQLLSSYHVQSIDMDAVFDAVGLRDAMKSIEVCLKSAFEFHEELAHGHSDEKQYYNFDRKLREIDVYTSFYKFKDGDYRYVLQRSKSIEKAVEVAKNTVDKIDKAKHGDFYVLAKDSVMAFDLCLDLLNLRQKLSDRYNGQGDISQQEWQKELAALKRKYSSHLSDDKMKQIDAAAIDIFDRGTSNFLREIVRNLASINRDLSEQTEEFMKKAVESGENLSRASEAKLSDPEDSGRRKLLRFLVSPYERMGGKGL